MTSHLTANDCGVRWNSGLAIALQWRHNGRDSVSNHQPHHCLLKCLFRRRWKKTSKPRITGLCVGKTPVTGEFPAKMASNAENVSSWWRHHGHCQVWAVRRSYTLGIHNLLQMHRHERAARLLYTLNFNIYVINRKTGNETLRRIQCSKINL